MARLGDIFTISSGGTPNKKEVSYYEGGTIPWVKTGDLKGKYVPEGIEYITESGLNNSSAKLFPKGTVLIAMYGATIGACSILPYDASTNQACAAFLPCREVLSEYLFYFLSGKKEQFVKDGVGGAQPNISAGYLKNVEFKLIPIDKQIETIRGLNKIDELISLRKQQLSKLDELVKSQFMELFGDPIKAPKYPLVAVGQVGDVMTGTTPSMKKSEYYNSNDIMFIKPGDIAEEHVTAITSSEAFISQTARSVGRIFPKNSVLVTCIGTIGKVGISTAESSCNQQINVIVPDRATNCLYLAHAMLYMRERLKEAANAPVVPILNKGDFSKITLPMPPLEFQQQFAAFVRQSDKSKFEIQKSLEKLETLKKALMQKYFGER